MPAQGTSYIKDTVIQEVICTGKHVPSKGHTVVWFTLVRNCYSYMDKVPLRGTVTLQYPVQYSYRYNDQVPCRGTVVYRNLYGNSYNGTSALVRAR